MDNSSKAKTELGSLAGGQSAVSVGSLPQGRAFVFGKSSHGRSFYRPVTRALPFPLSATIGQIVGGGSPLRMKEHQNMKRVIAGLALLSPAALFAQTATIPTASSMTTDIQAIAGVAAVAAALGFSIWLYRRVKSKAGQAVG